MISKQDLALVVAWFIAMPLVAGGADPAANAATAFAIRGTLPWHNFLSGPSAGDEEDYRIYLDRLADTASSTSLVSIATPAVPSVMLPTWSR